MKLVRYEILDFSKINIFPVFGTHFIPIKECGIKMNDVRQSLPMDEFER